MDNATKIRKVSALLQYVSFGVVVLILGFDLLFSFLIWRSPESLMPVIAARNTITEIHAGPWFTSIPAWLLFLLPSALMVYGAWRLGCMFRLFRQGAYFSEASAGDLLAFSLLGFLAQFLGPLFGALAGLVAQLGNENGSFELSIHIDGLEIIQLIAWATFMTVAWILREGLRLASENAEFI